jgi:hypothetical protein
VRLAIARFLFEALMVIGVPCLIALKLHLLPERVNKIAMWGLVLCFVLMLIRLTLLAFGD